MSSFREVNPRDLRLPSSRGRGADPIKLARQVALFGDQFTGMPCPWVYEGTDGLLVLYDGVTRATRMALSSPGALMRVEVIGFLPLALANTPRLGDLLP